MIFIRAPTESFLFSYWQQFCEKYVRKIKRRAENRFYWTCESGPYHTKGVKNDTSDTILRNFDSPPIDLSTLRSEKGLNRTCCSQRIFRLCVNVNKTFAAHKCGKTNLTGNSASSTRIAKCFLTKMTAQTKISVLTGPKRKKKRTKSAAREKGFKISLIIRSKNNNNTVYKTKSYLNIFSRYLVKRKQKYWSDTCWWTWYLPFSQTKTS